MAVGKIYGTNARAQTQGRRDQVRIVLLVLVYEYNQRVYIEIQFSELFGRIIADSFYEKADMEYWLEPKVPYTDYVEILELLWKPLLEKDLR